MPIINLEQGSESWLEWRKTLITASASAALLGKSGFNETPFSLWEKMLGFKTTFVNEGMKKGRMLEPLLRQIFIDMTGIWVDPVCLEHAKYPFLGASLDGFNLHEKVIVELKTGNAELYDAVKYGKRVRDDYYIQLQTQIACASEWDFKGGYLAVKDPDDDNCLTYRWYERDDSLIEAIIKASEDFYYNHLLTKIPPKHSGSEPIVQTSDRFKDLAKELDALAENTKIIEERKEKIKKELIELSPKKTTQFFGWKLSFTNSSTGIDYKKACAVNNIDTESYKRPPKERYILSQKK